MCFLVLVKEYVRIYYLWLSGVVLVLIIVDWECFV